MTPTLTLRDVARRERVAWLVALVAGVILGLAGCDLVRSCYADGGTYRQCVKGMVEYNNKHKGGAE